MRVLVIGAGWYGCHLATVLLKNQIKVDIVDRTNDFFQGSSSKNQNRLHLGYHYPRSDDTITECKEGYDQFCEKYGDIIVKFPKNLYFIEKNVSILPVATYIANLQKHCLLISPFQGDMPLPIYGMEEPIFEVEEQYIDPFKATNLFKETLSKSFIRIENKEAFASIDTIVKECNHDYTLVINCTYNSLHPIPCSHYELFVTLLYHIDTPELFAYTVMDGPFFSIYPYDIEKRIFTVTSVNHGPAYKGTDMSYAITDAQISEIRAKMDAQLMQYIPSWRTRATYVNYYTSWKTKHDTASDDRSLRHSFDGKVLNFYGGKITGIFRAEEMLLNIIRDHIKI